MQYAFIPSANVANVPCIFEIAVGSWTVRRIEADNGIASYTGLKGDAFTNEQQALIRQAQGTIFNSETEVNTWLTTYGTINVDFF